MKKSLKPLWLAGAVALGALAWYLSGSYVMAIVVFAGLLFAPAVQVYSSYAQDNPKHYWFKRKMYGWGWTPVTWQGWLVTIAYVGLNAAFAATIDENSPSREVALAFVLPLVLLTAAFIRIAYKKGEKPRWQWGIEEEK